MQLKAILLNQSNAVRTSILPEVYQLLNSIPIDHQSVKPYQTNIVEWLKPVIDLSGFSVYPMNGITEGLNWWIGREPRSIAVRSGDYQWVVPRYNHQSTIQYLSVPSAIDGNFIEVPCDQPVSLDLAYVGSTAVRKIDIQPNVEYVFYSLSKSFGVRNVRTGWFFSRRADHKLDDLIFGAKYYNYIAHDIAEAIIGKFPIDYVYSRLNEQQHEVCQELALLPSDSAWLATTYHGDYSKFRRQDTLARICLAPIYKL